MRKHITIRSARYEDVFACEKLLAAAVAESEVPLPPIEIPYAYYWYVRLVEESLAFVAECDGRLVGLILLGYQNWPWCDPRTPQFVSMPGLYVLRDFRKYGTGAQLIKKALHRCADLNLPFMVDTTNAVDPDKKDRWFRMMGFIQAGGKFFKAPG